MTLMTLALIGTPGVWELAIIAFIVLIIFGPGKIGQIGKAMGEGIRGFKKAADGDEIDVTPTSSDPEQLKKGDTLNNTVDTADKASKVNA